MPESRAETGLIPPPSGGRESVTQTVGREEAPPGSAGNTPLPLSQTPRFPSLRYLPTCWGHIPSNIMLGLHMNFFSFLCLQCSICQNVSSMQSSLKKTSVRGCLVRAQHSRDRAFWRCPDSQLSLPLFQNQSLG